MPPAFAGAIRRDSDVKNVHPLIFINSIAIGFQGKRLDIGYQSSAKNSVAQGSAISAIGVCPLLAPLPNRFGLFLPFGTKTQTFGE